MALKFKKLSIRDEPVHNNSTNHTPTVLPGLGLGDVRASVVAGTWEGEGGFTWCGGQGEMFSEEGRPGVGGRERADVCLFQGGEWLEGRLRE